ncbi:MAG: helix-turn-helix domain-containing protein [Planctomycetota bacterium]
MPAAHDAPKKKVDHGVAKRWTPKIAAHGWTPVSDFFLLNYHCFKPEITSAEAMFIIQLMHHKRDENPPYPGFKSLAKRMGVGVGTARGYARELEKKNYLEREKRVQTTNRFRLDPLFEAIEKLMAKQKAAAKHSPKVPDDAETEAPAAES